MISLPFLILSLLGCCVCAEVAGRVLRRILPADVDPRVARRIMWASRSFAVLYPVLQAINILIMFNFMQSPGSDPRLVLYAMTILTAALACAPLALVLGRSARSIAVGAIPLVAIVISYGVSMAVFAVVQTGSSVLWPVLHWSVWLACTFAGLKWVVPPMWPLDTSRFLRCPACGYSRAGLTVELCPECGGALPVQPAPDASRTG